MTDHANIDRLLRRIAPLLADIAKNAQTAAAEFERTEWAKRYLTRRASLHAVSGTARWRIAADAFATRQGELPEGVEFKTDDPDHNRGRYIAGSDDAQVLFTLRRQPHRDGEQPESIQMRLEEIRNAAPVEVGDGDLGVIYLSVPPIGEVATIGIKLKGQAAEIRPITEYLPDEGDMGDTPDDAPRRGPEAGRPGPNVGSIEDKDETGSESADG